MVDVDAAAYVSDIESSNSESGNTFFYTRDGQSDLFNVKAMRIDKDVVLRITVRTSAEEEIHTTKEFLRSPDNPDISRLDPKFDPGIQVYS